MNFKSTKVIELGSCAFRQWRATHSHCSKLHGYRLTAKFWFSCSHLDEKNWAVDFGDLKELKKILQDQFDHTTCVAADDPALASFEKLHNEGVVDLRIMDAVGAEATASWVWHTAAQYIREKYGDRCTVEQVEVFEHEDNSAIFVGYEIVDFGTIMPVMPEMQVEQFSTPVVPDKTIEEPSYNNNDRAAPVGRGPTSGIGGLFDGTIWGA